MGRRDAAVLQLVRPAGPEGSERLPDVRAAHVSAPPRRAGGVIPMPRLSALLTATLLAFAVVVVGCGGDDSLAPQVPGPPADVTVPDSGQSPTEAAASAQDRASSQDSASNSDSTSSDSSTSTDDTGTTDSTGTDTGTTGDTSGGTAAPDTGTDSPQNDTAPPSGSDAQQFEDFCAQNQGAC